MNKKSRNEEFRWGSFLTGCGMGLLIGYWLQFTTLAELIDGKIPHLNYLFMGIGLLIFGYLGYTKQKLTEILAYVTSVFIIYQFVWDDVAENVVGPIRYGLFYRGLILLLLNASSGHYQGLHKVWSILRRAVGMK